MLPACEATVIVPEIIPRSLSLASVIAWTFTGVVAKLTAIPRMNIGTRIAT